MDYSFSFSGDLYLKLLKEYENCIPGIEKMIICFRGRNAAITCYQKEPEIIVNTSLDLKEHAYFIESGMNETFTYKWLRKYEVPFENTVKRKIKKQLDIEDEIKMPVLLIRIESGIPNMCDLLFIYLNENTSANFFMSKEVIPYSRQTKEYMGYMLYQRINQDADVWRKDQHILKNIQESYKMICENMDILENHNKTMGEFFRGMCDYILDDISSESGLTVKIEEDAYHLLLENGKNIMQIKNMILKATQFKTGMSSGKEIIIKKREIISGKASGIKEKESPEIDDTEELKKAYNYLELFENISQKANTNQMISLKYIAAEWGNKTSSAVTEAINTRKEVVIKLLEIYPDRWSRIRAELAPVRKLDNEVQKKITNKNRIA